MIKKFYKKVIAQRPEDLSIISALCSQAKVKQSDIKFLKNILLELTILGWPNNVFMNINFPYCTADLVKSIQITTQGNRETDDLIINEVQKSKFRFGLRRRLEENVNLSIPPLNETVEGYMSDVEALADHHISITPLHLDLTHHKSLSDLKKGLKTDLN